MRALEEMFLVRRTCGRVEPGCWKAVVGVNMKDFQRSEDQARCTLSSSGVRWRFIGKKGAAEVLQR
ncbi:uncharacterized protein RSE6_14723 [Rhynchosporium secalis]|uniref:Uncharacterized protein n=1 Tax=Rhynchosporium secalis TaxID=38038 RepID=A0A1E1MVZ8_RHYSE|nr:uncharacterized protein RSE6_14723 [Rhynchosporium secalis]